MKEETQTINIAFGFVEPFVQKISPLRSSGDFYFLGTSEFISKECVL
jgi:hypothetical protein